MRTWFGRLLVGLLLVVGSGFGVARAAPMAATATTWQLKVGGGSPDRALEAMAFLPTTVTINVGDTINWTFAGPHTVSFLSGAPRPPLAVGSDAGPIFNPQVAFPAGGPTYDGTGYVNSGLLPNQNSAQFALTFTKPGTYTYVCLLHPGMNGVVVVQPAGSAYPMTQAQVDVAGNAELYAKLSTGLQLLQAAKLTSKPADNGATNYTVVNGTGGNQASVLRFLPVDVTIKVGDRITWVGDDPHEIHTVTFYDANGPVPGFIEPRPQANGPPLLALLHVAPEGGTEVTGQGLYNSGILGPGQSYTLSFTKPGVYRYVCVIHAEVGMTGTVTVEAAAPAAPPAAPPATKPPATKPPVPAALPNTGLNGSSLLVLALIGAVLVLGGARIRRRCA